MKLELKIEAPGVQIYAYEIDQEIQGLIDKNANDGFPVRGMEIVEERVSPILVSNGIAPRKNSCKYTAIINGEEKPFYPIYFYGDWMNPEDIEDSIKSSEWPDLTSQDCIWIPDAHEEFLYMPGTTIPLVGNCVIFEIVPYSHGTLHTSLEVEDNFKLGDLKLVTDCVDGGQDLESIAHCYYNKHFLFDEIRDKYGHTAFDEDSIRAIEYNGKQYFFDLDFYGGSDGWYVVLEKDKEDYFATHFASILGGSWHTEK